MYGANNGSTSFRTRVPWLNVVLSPKRHCHRSSFPTTSPAMRPLPMSLDSDACCISSEFAASSLASSSSGVDSLLLPLASPLLRPMCSSRLLTDRL